MKIIDKMHQVTKIFADSGFEEARTDARELIAFGIGCSTIFVKMNPQFEIDEKSEIKIDEFVQRRLAFEPVSKIKGYRGFWSLDFKVTQDVLDPRPDSETDIESVLKYKTDKDARLKILDLGTGSGCLALSLLSEYIHAEAIGVDKSEEALKVANENAKLNGLSERFKTIKLDWNEDGWEQIFEQEKFDILISNPPYIRDDEQLQKEVVLYDPKEALFGGKDGLDPYRIISPKLPYLLKNEGIAVFEFGIGQHNEVKSILKQENLHFIEFGTDLGGVLRCIVLQKNEK